MGCRRRAPVAELVRVSVHDGGLLIGPGPGRGAWLCPTEACLRAATRARSLSRALRVDRLPADLDLLVAACSGGAPSA